MLKYIVKQWVKQIGNREINILKVICSTFEIFYKDWKAHGEVADQQTIPVSSNEASNEVSGDKFSNKSALAK